MDMSKPQLDGITRTPFAEATMALRYFVGEICVYISNTPIWRTQLFSVEPKPPVLDVAELFLAMPAKARALVVYSWPVDAAVPKLRFTREAIAYVPEISPRYYLQLARSFDEYLRCHFDSKSRYNVKQLIRKFTDLSGGCVDFRQYRMPSEMAEFHTHACSVSRLTYQQQMLRAGLPDTREFRDELEREAARDNIRGHVLFHQGNPIAFSYCRGFGDWLTLSVIGYDPKFKRWSPGTVLLLLSLERLFLSDRFRIYDFGPGEAQYKARFSTARVMCADLYYFKWSLRNLVAVTAHACLSLLTSFVGRMLEQLGMKQRVRLLLRRWSLTEAA